MIDNHETTKKTIRATLAEDERKVNDFAKAASILIERHDRALEALLKALLTFGQRIT